MKKLIVILILFVSVTLSAQKLSTQFDVKAYATEQTDMIKSTFDLTQNQVDQVYKANLHKAYSIHKYIILAEKQNKVANKKLPQIIKEVNANAERGSGFQTAMKRILGEEKYQQFIEKYGSK
jgi:hypothetical protein